MNLILGPDGELASKRLVRMPVRRGPLVLRAAGALIIAFNCYSIGYFNGVERETDQALAELRKIDRTTHPPANWHGARLWSSSAAISLDTFKSDRLLVIYGKSGKTVEKIAEWKDGKAWVRPGVTAKTILEKLAGSATANPDWPSCKNY